MSKLDKVDRQKAARPTVTKVHRPERGKIAPVFDSFFDAVPGVSTLDLSDIGDPEDNINQEMSAALSALVALRAERREIFRLQVDVNYFFCVVFQSVDQKEEFLRRAGWDDLGLQHLDGLALARRLGVDIAPINLPKPTPVKAPKRLRESNFIEIPESKTKGGDNK